MSINVADMDIRVLLNHFTVFCVTLSQFFLKKSHSSHFQCILEVSNIDTVSYHFVRTILSLHLMKMYAFNSLCLGQELLSFSSKMYKTHTKIKLKALVVEIKHQTKGDWKTIEEITLQEHLGGTRCQFCAHNTQPQCNLFGFGILRYIIKAIVITFSFGRKTDI